MIPGFQFCPSDRVLLSYYLLKRLKGEPTEFQIPEVDVYSIEPWRLFDDLRSNDSDDDDDIDDDATCSSNNNLRYVFTNIKKKHGHGNRFGRTVTISSSSNNQVVVGTWKGQKAQKGLIKDSISKEIIGVKKMYSFTLAPSSKQDHDDEDNEAGNSKKQRKRKITTTTMDNIDQLDGISYIMHEYSMAGSSNVLCRIRRKIDKEKKMNNKKLKYSSSSCNSKNITKKNTCWDDQHHQGAEYDQPLQGRMSYDHKMMINTSVFDDNQSSMLQQHQSDQVAEYYQPLQQGSWISYDDQHQMMMMNTSVLDHDQSSMLQQQQPDQDAEYGQQLQGRMSYDDQHQMMMMNTSVLDHDQSSMSQQQRPDQDAAIITGGLPIIVIDDDDIDDPNMNTCTEGRTVPATFVQSEAGVTGGLPILADDDDADMNTFAQDLEENMLTTTTSTSTSNGDEDKITGAGHEVVEEEEEEGEEEEEEEEEEDLSNQQQQPPAATSEGEGNLAFLSSLGYQFDDSPEIDSLYSSSLGFQFVDPPLDIDAIIQQSTCV